MTREQVTRLIARGFISPPQVRGRGRRTDQDQAWTPLHLRQLLFYCRCRRDHLHGRRLAMRYWWQTGMAEKQATRFLKQVSKAMSVLFPALTASEMHELGLAQRTPQQAIQVLKSYGSLLDSFMSYMQQPPDMTTGSSVARAQMLIFRVASGRGAIPSRIREDLNARILSALLAGISLVALPSRYLNERTVGRLLDESTPTTLEACRRRVRDACASLLHDRIIRFAWRNRGNLTQDIAMAFRTTGKTIPAKKRRRVGFAILTTPESHLALLIIGTLALPAFAAELWGDDAEEQVQQTFRRLAMCLHSKLTGNAVHSDDS